MSSNHVQITDCPRAMTIQTAPTPAKTHAFVRKIRNSQKAAAANVSEITSTKSIAETNFWQNQWLPLVKVFYSGCFTRNFQNFQKVFSETALKGKTSGVASAFTGTKKLSKKCV